MFKRLFVFIMLLLFSSTLVFAESGYDDQGNPNDPTVNDRANACYEGGSMEGKCDSIWEWECGWYLIQFEYDLLEHDGFPTWCASIIPPEILPEVLVDNTIFTYCGTLSFSGPWIFYYTGTPNQVGNLWYYHDDTTCTGNPQSVWTGGLIVEAASQSAAETICQNFYEFPWISSAGISGHSELWYCQDGLI